MTLGVLAIALLVVAAVAALVLVYFESEVGAALGGAVCVAVAVGYGMSYVIVIIGGRQYGTIDLILASAQASVIALVFVVALLVAWRLRSTRSSASSK